MAGMVRESTRPCVKESRFEEYKMSFLGIRADSDINLDEFERQLRAPGAQQASAEHPLAELAGLIESSMRPPEPSPSTVPADSKPLPTTDTETMKPSGKAVASESGYSRLPDRSHAGVAADRLLTSGALLKHAKRGVLAISLKAPEGIQSLQRKLKVSLEGRRPGVSALAPAAAALVGAALVGAVFWPRGGAATRPNEPPFIAAVQGPSKAPPPKSETAGAAIASPLRVAAQPGDDRVVGSGEKPIDRNDPALLANAPPSAASAPAPADAPQPADAASAGAEPPVAAALDAPLVEAPMAAHLAAAGTSDSPPDHAASQSPSAQQNATAASPAKDEAAHTGDAQQLPETPAPKPAHERAELAQPPERPAPKAARELAEVAQPPAKPAKVAREPAEVASTPKVAVPAKLTTVRPSHNVVARADATAETRSAPPRLGAYVIPQTAAEPQAEPLAADHESPGNPVTRAFGYVFGALTPASGPQQDDQKAVSNWAVQFAAPKSEAQAKIDAARLNSKYAAALNGATIGVHKTEVNGETSYALRVGGLSKADAAALCDRVRGHDCSLAK